MSRKNRSPGYGEGVGETVFSGGANMDTVPLLRVPRGIRLMAGTGNLPASVHPAQQKKDCPKQGNPFRCMKATGRQ